MEKDNKIKQNIEEDDVAVKNTNLIEDKLKGYILDGYIEKNLSGYLANALRITHYYGNLRIKYLGFNYSVIAFFASTIAIYMSFSASINLWLLFSGVPIIIGLFLYYKKFKPLHDKSFDTISLKKHKDLQHYSCIMDKNEYPELIDGHLNKFLKLLKANKQNNPIKNDLETLILQYLYQANYNNIALRMRECLLYGFKALIITIAISIVVLVVESIVLLFF